MRLIVLCAAGIVSAALACSGCETTKGLGEDIENTGTNLRQGVENVDPKEKTLEQRDWNETQDTGNQSNKTK